MNSYTIPYKVIVTKAAIASLSALPSPVLSPIMISFLVILLGCACLMGVAECAGMTSHNVAARRASQFEFFGPKSSEFNPDDFYGLADYRSDAIQAGSPFPDYLYACGDEHDAGEVFSVFDAFYSSHNFVFTGSPLDAISNSISELHKRCLS